MTDLLRACDLEEAAERLGVTVRTIFEWRKEGIIRTVQLGRFPRVPMSEIARLLTPADEPIQQEAKKVELFPRVGA